MDQHTWSLMDIRLDKTKHALERNNMKAIILEKKEDVRTYLKDTLEAGDSVSLGGSQSLFESGVVDLMSELPIDYKDRYASGLTRDEVLDVFREAFHCDYYIASTNAVSTDGKLFNIDGTGNRVSAMIFGPKKVILVVGYNKIVDTIDEAKQRARNIAAPANNERLGKKNPCVKNGLCMDCSSETRICSSFVSLEKQAVKDRITVLLVKEELGY